MRDRSTVAWVVLVVFVIAGGTIPVFATPSFGYTPVAPPPTGEDNHAQILSDIYEQNFTADGLNYVGDSGITAIRTYDFDDILYNTVHVYHYEPNDVDQIWTDGAVTVTALAKYASYDQAFGWNSGGTEGTNFTLLVDDSDIGGPGVSFKITEDQEFLWGYQARRTGCPGWWWQPGMGLEWWSLMGENNGEDHMVTYLIEGLTTEKVVWAIFMEDLRFGDCIPSDLDYNDFVVEIRAIPEPATMLLLGVGVLVFVRKPKVLSRC